MAYKKLDQYDEDYFTMEKEVKSDPQIEPTKRHPRTVRGGAYKDIAPDLRCANRVASDLVWNRRDPQIPKSKWWNADAPFIGFRIIRPMQQPDAAAAAAFYDKLLTRK